MTQGAGGPPTDSVDPVQSGDIRLSGDPSPRRGPGPIKWLRGFVLDLRSLALFRIALGACLLGDLLIRLPQMGDFYTDDGVLPREALIRLGNPWKMSLHLISGEWAIQLALFLTAIVLAIGFLAGYRTRQCAVASWVLLLSMHVRNPMVVHGGDALLRLLLFWSMFVPVNARCSVDRALNPSAPPLATRHLSAAGAALILQVCAMYWFAFSEKMHPVWLTERSAVYYALNLDIYATSFGKSLLAYPELLRNLTTGTLLLELLGPIVAISPILTTPARLVAVSAFIGFHAGLGLSLRLGIFSWISAAAWTPFLPSLVWDTLGRRVPRLTDWGAAANRWTLRVLGPRTSPPAPRTPGMVANLVVVGALVVVTLSLWSQQAHGPIYTPTTDYGYRVKLSSLSGLGQRWRMFAPLPSPEDGWYVIEGVKEDGTRIDLWSGGQPNEAKPRDFGAAYRSTQWLAFLVLLWNRGLEPYRVYFGRYLCRGWNGEHRGTERVDTALVSFMLELTPPMGQPVPQPTKVLVLRQNCADKPVNDR